MEAESSLVGTSGNVGEVPDLSKLTRKELEAFDQQQLIAANLQQYREHHRERAERLSRLFK